ncbi:MAG: hypothetical protein IPK02_09950 [Candidatus Accumulibacter sp.]|uniref:PKD domain-containing protein n=1 Tax=Candidatus Accumulibacter affinis TaxID=2954384 RepID=A0A935TD89_9PROT|nr:hypothetical protein [Candidatus Accumulibacter affinis]
MKVFGEQRINTYFSNSQSAPAVAALSGGGQVVTWVSNGQDGSGEGIYAQRLDANGVGVGPEFRVSSTTSNAQTDPAVVGLSDGGFIVAWSDNAADGSGWGVYGQRYNAAGVAQGAEFRINSYTSSDQYQPAVAAYDGGFVVTWTSYSDPADSEYGVFGSRFDNAGNRLATAGADEFKANTYAASHQWESDVATRADGSFVVVWRSEGQEGDGYSGVYAQRFDSSGARVGVETHVNSYTANYQYQPRVATLSDGGFVVVWTSRVQDGSNDGVYGQRYDSAGNTVGGEFLVNVATDYDQAQPDVTGLSTGGFVVTWYNYYVPAEGKYYEIYVREYDAGGVPIGSEQKVNTYNGPNQTQVEPVVADLGQGNYVVTWSSYTQDGSEYGVYQQIFGDPAKFTRQANPELGDFGGTVTFGENAVNAGFQVLDAAVSLTDSDSSHFNGGRVEVFYVVGGSSEDQLGVHHQGSAPGQIGVSGNSVTYGGATIGTLSGGGNGANLVINLNVNATVAAVEQLVQNLGYANSSSSPSASRQVSVRVSDGDGGSTLGDIVTVNVTRETDGTPRAYGEEQVNSYTYDYQHDPEVARLADGGYVVVWTSRSQDSSGDPDGIYGQRYSASGVAVGPEFRVPGLTGSSQEYAHVAGLSNGGFVVTWQDNAGYDGSGYGVYGQRYDATGLAQGSQFLLNTYTDGTQYNDAVVAYAGGFAAVWSSPNPGDGGYQDIYLQRWTNDGSKAGGELLVSTTPGNATVPQSGHQYVPDIAALSDGDLLIVWRDDQGNDDSSHGVYARRFDSALQTFGDSFLVNTDNTIGAQYEPKVAALSDGGYVIVWRDDNQDGNSTAVMGQRYAADSSKVGSAFQVNEYTVGGQYEPAVIGLSTGGFVVSFFNDNYGPDGTPNNVYLREYDAAGNPVDGDRLVNTYTTNNQQQPAMANLGQGNYVVVWRSDYQDGSNSGVYQQIFGDTAELPRQANPEVADFVGTVTFLENTVNAGLQVIDPAVSLNDSNSADFNGGRLDLYYLTGAAAEDQLGVVSQGGAPGQIGVAGNVVSYGGTAIGTISGGSNGANLRIDFTSSAASVEAVELLIQRLGYSNADSSPNATRSLALRVSDGDGGSSTPNVLTINVTPQQDGTPKAYGEEQVNTYVPNSQSDAAVAKLSGGGYVVVWNSSSGQDGSADGVYAQRYSGSGVAVGPEFRVNTTTSNSQGDPAVVGLSDGSFVVTWADSNGTDGSSSGVYAQRVSAGGVALGSQFLVNTYTNSDQAQPKIAAYAGGFVATWYSNGQDNWGHGVYSQRFDNAGVKSGGEIQVSSDSASHQYEPDVAARSDGSFVIVYRSDQTQDGSGVGVYAQRFDSAGAKLGSEFQVNTTTYSNQTQPRVAMLSDGDFVVVWYDDGGQDGSGGAVFGQRFNSDGTMDGSQFRVNEFAAGSQYQPAVIGLSTGGFVVSFYNDNWGSQGSYSDVYVREYDAAGNAVDGDRQINTAASNYYYSGQSQPALADLGNGNYVTVWTSDGLQDGSSNGIYQQLFGDTGELPRQANPDLADFVGTVTFDENVVNGGLQVIDAAVSLSDSDSANFNGGRLDLYYLTGAAAQDQLGVLDQGAGAGQIGVAGNTVSYGGTPIGTISGGANGANLRIDFTSNTATPDAVEALIQRLGYANTESSPNASRTLGLRVSDGDGGASTPNVLTINVTPQEDGTPKAYGEEQVNTFVPNSQSDAAVAKLSGGGYVVVWNSSSAQDGSADGVYAQRYSGSGVAVGPEFRVNTTTSNSQYDPAVVGLSDGSFVVAWTDNAADGSSEGVFAQRFDSAGVALGSQFAVNTYTNSNQAQPKIAAYAGGFVATWYSYGEDNYGHGVYSQRFDNAGVKSGGEIQVSSDFASYQYEPDVAARADGSFVIVYRSDQTQDGSGVGVYAQRFDSAGAKLGGEFLVNTTTANSQYQPRVAMLSDGDFVVVWYDDGGQDGSGGAVFGQRFNPDGTTDGSEFRVNQFTTGSQLQPAVIGLSTGGFVVSFYNDNLGSQGTYYDVYVREYDAAGNAVDGDRQINTAANNYYYSGQSQPALADLGNGNYVTVWTSDGLQDGSSNGIYQQLFGDTGELPRQANPVLNNLTETRVLGATEALSAQLIDASVQVQDSDSANFDGGSLWVFFASGQAAADTLAINNQGTSPLQIGVSGSNVTFGGTVIGTFAGGTGGAPLVVSFDADATPEAVRYLTQNITYQYNDAPAPESTRSVAFRLFDGDGGASLPASTSITIQTTAPAATLRLSDLDPGITLAEPAAQLGVLLDASVQLDAGAAGFNGGSLTVSYLAASSREEDQLSIRNEGSGTDQVGFDAGSGEVSYQGVLIGTLNVSDTGANGDSLVVNFNASATASAIERVIENLRYQTTSDGPLASRSIQLEVTDAASASTAQTLVINITPEADGAQALFGDEQVNTFIANDQYYPFVRGLQGANAGSYVVVWQSNLQDGDGWGIFAQRYNAQGVQVGSEFQVNTYTPAAQTEAKLASLADGGFVVVWRSEGQDGSSGGVYGQRYDASGAPAGSEFQVSTTVAASDQTHPQALGLADGSFVIAWADQYRDTSSYGSYAHRYAADGTPLGSDFLLNTYLPSEQYAPYLAALKDDPGTPGADETGFIAVWESNGQDGSYFGVYAQRFDVAGNKVDGEFKVNTNTSNGQVNPDVAVLTNSHIVVVWHDQSDASIRGQLFTAGGISIGGEFAVSTPDYNSDYGQWPHVTALANGGFAVSWDGYSSPSDGEYGVYAQQFDANGNKIDGPLQLNGSTANNQHYPNLTGLSGGNFVAVWEGNYHETDGNSSHGIFQRVFGTPGSIVRQASPELIDLETSVSFNENDVNAGAQLIDPGVRVVDVDSSDFAGGRLVVSVISGYGALQSFNAKAPQQDNFSIRDQGAGAGQVGFDSGTGVLRYGGTAIGSIVSNGQSGADLVVQFNASASAAAVEAVIENLTYHNPTSDPAATRKVSIVVSDGDGGQSAPRMIDINVTAQTDGAVRLLSEDQQVNTYTASNQELPMIAALQGGNAGQYVIVWQSYGQDSDSWGVFGQRYDVNGSAIGPEFQVNTTTPGAQYGQNMVGIGALSTGGFVVAWESGDGSGNGIYAQRYDANGQPLSGEFQVNRPAENYAEQIQPRVLGLDGGAFVIAYADGYYADGDSYGVRVQHYDASGVAAAGGPVTVNTAVANNQSFPQLARLNDGGYVVVWHSLGQDGDNWGVFAQRMNADGSARGGEIQVNSYTANNQSNPDVATLANGDFVVSWVSNNPGLGGWSIMVQRFTAAGVKVGGEVLVNDGNTAITNGDSYSQIAALESGGYVVTWSAYPAVDNHDVYAQQFGAADNKIDAPLRLNNYTSSTQYRPEIAALPGDRFVAAWQSYGQDGDVYGIYQGLFGAAGSLTRSAAPVITDLAPSVTIPENTANLAAGVLIDPAVSVSDADSSNFDGGRLTVSVISGYNSLGTDLSQNLPLQDHFSIRDQGNGAGQVGFNAGVVSYAGVSIGNMVTGFNGQNGVDLVIEFNASASAEAVEAVIENLTYRNSSSDPVASRTVSVLLTDGDGGSSVPRTVQINVTSEADGAIPLFDGDQVNTYATSTQSEAAMARLGDGGYVTMWQSSGQDGWGWGIFGQRFAADGTRVGNEFRVSDSTPYEQTEVSVAGLKDGGFVAVYRDQYGDASGDSVVGQRFDANGVRVGGEFVVNTSTNGNQYQPSITALADGGFAVAWYSDGVRDGEYYDVFFQRYNASGTAVGGETRANTAIAGQAGAAQYEPGIVQLSTGDLLVAWRSDGQDGSNSGVYAQRFSSAGAAIGTEFQLNTYTSDYQYDPQLTPTATGFVVAWTSRGQDGSADGIYARLYDNHGDPTSAEFRVNESSYHHQWEPAVTTLANGGFAIAWRGYNANTGDWDTYAQQFDAAGNRVDGETRVDGPTTGEQQPALVGLNNCNFVVSWFGYSDASDAGIFQRVVGNAADFPRQTAPVIVDLTSSVTFLENQINDTPQLIDPGIGLIDPDSANFAGGRLDVSYVTPYGNPDQFDIPGINAQDQLGIRNEGVGVDQIGVSGGNVTYNFGDGAGAVVIGSILSDGVNGKALTVVFNANATPEAAEALIENLTYQNLLSNPEPSRTISLSLSDGDGGVTAPKAITINITAQPDGAVPFGAEKVVNTTTPGTQEAPSIAYLSNDSYVVVWQDTTGQDGSGYGVFARIYDSLDNPLADQFQINSTTSSTQYQPRVIALEGGGFTVAWAGYNQISATGYDIVGRQFNNSGGATSDEFAINRNVPGEVEYEQSMPDLAALHNGGFVAVWHGYYEQASGRYYDIYGQRYSAAGARDGEQFRVNTSTGFENSYQDDPAVSTLADGRFVVVWRSDSQDGSSAGVYGQRFNADGTPDGAEFRANSYTANGQYQQDVTALKDGGYVVVWGSDSGQDTSGWGIYGQRYDASGQAVGGEFRVNYTVSGTQYQPAVAPLVNGGFVVSWSDGDEIWLQQYDSSGHKVDSQQSVNADGNYGYSSTPDLVSTPDGGFIVTYGGYNYGNSSYDVFLQRFSNTAPNIQDVSVVGPEDANIILTDELFAAGFFDAEGQALAAIKVVTLPASGILKLDGVNVTPGQIISVADLAANKLSYLGNLNFNGPDQFRWTGSDGNVFAINSVFTNITVNNVNDGPALEAGVDGTAQEGTYFTRGITLGDPDTLDTHLVTVSWLGSGGQTGSYQFSTSADAPSIGLTLPDDGTYTVNVTANDQQGQPNSIETDSFQVVVSNVAPTIDLSGNNTVEQGQVYTLLLANPYDPGADTVSEYRINWGDGMAVEVIPVASLPASRNVTHTFASAGAPSISVALVDEDGTHANAGNKAIVVAPPSEVIVVDAGADIAANEGAYFGRTITFTDPADQDPAGRDISVDWGDGSAVENYRINTAATSFNINHAFADNRVTPYTVTVTVNDDGFQQAADSFDVTVNDVAPTLGLSGNGSAAEGSVYTLTLGSVNDPGADTVSQYVVHWGDGNTQSFLPAELLANRQVQHVYNDGDVSGTSRTITVDLVNEDGTFLVAGSHGVTVTNVPPSVPVSGADSSDEGASYVLTVGTVVDPGVDTPTLYRIDWGDGTPSNDYTPAEYATLLVAGGTVNHVFADAGSSGVVRTVSMQVWDEDGIHTAASKAITVNNVAPTIALDGAASVNEGASYTLTLGAISDPGTDSVSSYVVHWGDGLSDTYASAGEVSHVYADGLATPTINVDLVDEDGTHSNAGSKAITVNNVAPTIALGGAASVNEGASYTLTMGVISDPGTDSVSSYVVHWGDGLSDTYASAGEVSHVYADGLATPTINVDLVDEDGTYSNAGSKAITVNNVAPTIALGGAASVNEGASYTLTLGAISDPGTDSVSSYVVHWGDGLSDAYTSAGEVSHVYADGLATPTINVDLVDEDGTHSNAGSKAITVNNVAPDLSATGAATGIAGVLYTLTLSDYVDPGQDAPLGDGIGIDWGDGSGIQQINALGDVTHTFASAGDYSIRVSLTDDDGHFDNVAEVSTTIGAASANVAIAAQADGVANEGDTFTRIIAFSDGEDSHGDGWEYTVNWSDGVTQSGTTTEQQFVLSRAFADGPASATASITVSDTGGADSDTVGFGVTVNNVAPTIALGGAASVNEGASYTLTLGAISDPGTDSVSSYVVHWGDGLSDTYASAGEVSHVYADGLTTPTINVDLVDEDGTHSNAGSKAITVNNVAPDLSATGAATGIAGVLYTLTLADYVDPGQDALLADGIGIDWGDGSGIQTVNALGEVTHTFASSGSFSIQVSMTDEDGTFANVASVDTQISAASANVAIAAQADGVANEGDTFTRIIAFSDGEDSNGDGWEYTVNWSDGVTQSGTTTEQQFVLSRAFADGPASATASITVSDTGGADSDTAGFGVTVNNVAPTIALGGAASVNEGASYTLTLGAISDPGTDSVSSYVVHWGDGLSDTYASAGEVSHVYADGLTTPTINVDLVDEDGTYSNAASKAITVNNVAPDLSAAGAATGIAGVLYTLTLSDYVDPGQDALVADGIGIDWGDGSGIQTVNALGDVTHTFASGGDYSIRVSLTDDDGHFDNVAEVSTTIGAAATGVAIVAQADGVANEGDTFTRTIAFSDGEDSHGDGWTYTANWSDGVTQSGTTTEQQFVLSRAFADGPASATASITVSDVGGADSDTADFKVDVADVAPTIALGGADRVKEGSFYTLNLGKLTDPGADTVAGYVVHWGDGLSDSYTSGGDVTHLYGKVDGDLARTITVDLADEDGSHTAVASKEITVSNVIYLGNAMGAVTLLNQYAWAPFWTDGNVRISHKANSADAGEAWSDVSLHPFSASTLAGGDLYGGDLGVSGQNQASSSVRQEIQGAESLRFDLKDPANTVTLNLSQFFQDDDANLFNYNEAGRLQVLDKAGNVLDEVTFAADGSSGKQMVTLTLDPQEHPGGFSSVVLNAGAYDEPDHFVFGAYVNDAGEAQDPYSNAGKLHGSDFLVHDIELAVPLIGLPLDHGF